MTNYSLEKYKNLYFNYKFNQLEKENKIDTKKAH